MMTLNPSFGRDKYTNRKSREYKKSKTIKCQSLPTTRIFWDTFDGLIAF